MLFVAGSECCFSNPNIQHYASIGPLPGGPSLEAALYQATQCSHMAYTFLTLRLGLSPHQLLLSSLLVALQPQ